MRTRDILHFIEDHYSEFPNFDGRTPGEVVEELPDQDPRYADEAGLIDLLQEVSYRGDDTSGDEP